MRFAILVVALALLVAAPTARAQTTILEPVGSHYPYQRWVEEARVPTPDVTLTVFEIPSEAHTSAGAFTIWLNPQPSYQRRQWEREAREDFYHELGHNVDYYTLPGWARWRFAQLLGDSRPWDAPPNSLKEKFAEAYMRCAMSPVIERRPIEFGYEYQPSPALHQKVCRMILMASLFP